MIIVELQQIVCVLLVLKYAQTLYISNGVRTADDANDQCRLAVPPIQYTRHGITVALHQGDLSTYPKLWVGYARIYQAFLYIGCIDRDDNEYETTHRDIMADPGQCLSLCNSSFVGIEEDRCRCISSPADDLLDNGCRKYCEFPSGATCGEKGEAASIYKPVAHNEDAPGADNSDFLCRAFDPVQSQYIWEDCSVHLNLTCQTGPYTNAGDVVYVHKDKSSRQADGWHMNMRRCIKDDKYPADEGTNVNVPDKYGRRWIGIVRSFVISEISSTYVATVETDRTKPGFKQGYIERAGDIFYLKFDTVGLLYALCNDSGRTTTSSTTLSTTTTDRPSSLSTGPDLDIATSLSTLHTTEPTVTDNPSSSSMETGVALDMCHNTGKITSLSSPYTTATTKSSHPYPSSTRPVTDPHTNEIPGTSTMDNGGQGNANANASGQTVIYVVVPLLVASAMLVAVIVIYRKRKHRCCVHTDANDHKIVEKDAIIPADAVVNAAYQYDDVLKTSPTNYSSPEVFAIEQCNEYEMVDSANVENTGADNYDRTTTNTNICTLNDTGNVYNRLNVDAEDTYNRTNETVDMAGDTYSHVGNDLSTLEYSTTEALTQKLRNAQVPENSYYYSSASNRDDTYNHLNGATSNTDINVFVDGTYNNTNNVMHPSIPDKMADVYTYAQTTPTRTVGPHTGSVQSDYAST